MTDQQRDAIQSAVRQSTGEWRCRVGAGLDTAVGLGLMGQELAHAYEIAVSALEPAEQGHVAVTLTPDTHLPFKTRDLQLLLEMASRADAACPAGRRGYRRD